MRDSRYGRRTVAVTAASRHAAYCRRKAESERADAEDDGWQAGSLGHLESRHDAVQRQPPASRHRGADAAVGRGGLQASRCDDGLRPADDVLHAARHPRQHDGRGAPVQDHPDAERDDCAVRGVSRLSADSDRWTHASDRPRSRLVRLFDRPLGRRYVHCRHRGFQGSRGR